MKTILKPIALDEQSYNVTLLHKALRALGISVADDEVAQRTAGEDTLEKVRALQVQLNVPVDDSVLVDEATAFAIATALNERGLTAASRTFTVSGTVRLPDGTVKKRQKLLAYDLDLRGVAVYRTIKNLSEIEKTGGFEFLNEAVSDNMGNYRIAFYDWQYEVAERKKADVVVYAHEGEEIIGLSRMVNSEDYSDKGLLRDLDVIITQEDKRTEYAALMSALNPFLEESQTSLAEIATSYDQLVFTAGELDVDQSRIIIAAAAELLVQEEDRLSHELLYGIGRQNIRLSWGVLYKKQEDELRRAIAKSVEERIIRKFKKKEITAFLQVIEECAVRHMLDESDADDGNTLNAMLTIALPEEEQRISFVNAFRGFKGSDFRDFWRKHLPSQPEFKDNPELISKLLFTQQLTRLTGNHQALVEELQVNRQQTSMHELIDLEKSDWVEIIEKTGVPDGITGKNDEEKIDTYAEMMQSMLNAAFPTQRIAKLIKNNELPIEKLDTAKHISTFLTETKTFDFAGSRIHDFKEEIETIAEEDYDEVRTELMKIQRIFQVSTSPEAMKVLMENNLHSAYTIAAIPRKSFMKTYGKALGNEHVAFAIHQRACHISTKSELTAMHLMEYSHAVLPGSVMSKNESDDATEVLQSKIPNYSDLFGCPDICECEHCRSVYSAAAYFVDLLRFLHSSTTNPTAPITYTDSASGATKNLTALDVLVGNKDAGIDGRRPDLVALRLTCENTNTLIPYIDLANEVMEYYTVHDSLTDFEGYDTGEATAEELQAYPQNFELDAYRKLKDAKYPFTLPYHQPLDVIRTFSDHLKVSRYEALKAMNPERDEVTQKAIEAESLEISPEEYIILAGEAFDGTEDLTELYEYYGYDSEEDFAKMQDETDADENPRGIRVLLERTGLAYTDLVELVCTLFINPYQGTLIFLEKIFSYASIDANTLYAWLGEIETGTLNSGDKDKIQGILNAYNRDNDPSITFIEFSKWVKDHLAEFRQVITLYEPDSRCDLGTTQLRTIQSIYESPGTSGITDDTWTNMHRFIRLWRKLGWSIHETDLVLAALGEDNITTETISQLASVSLLHTDTKLPLNQLAVLWGNIDTYGDQSLYKKLFLNQAVQEIDEAFNADAWGNYLQNELDENGDPITLANHQSTIIAAFRITEEDLGAILEVAEIIDNGNPRNLDLDSDILNIQNLSTLYRYVVLAKGLSLGVTDLCKIICLFGASPFSRWDVQQEEFTNISSKDTYEFYRLASSTTEGGFTSSVLEYILDGTLPADSTIGIDKDNALHTAKAIRDAFAAIEQDHPETPESPLTSETLTAKLSLTFQPEIVSQFMSIIEGTVSFETITDDNLNVTIPDDLAEKYTYVNGSGRLTCAGIMTDTEKETLKNLDNANANFQAAVDELYTSPETFISDNFSGASSDLNGVFSDLDEAKEKLLDHPAQDIPVTLDEKFTYVYERFLPLLKCKLRQDVITQHIAALIGLGEEATALLIANDIDALITSLSTEGFSANYFNDVSWTTSVLEGVDGSIDFSWGEDAPDPLVSADNFSTRWKAYIAAPASGKYALVVEVEEEDDVFKLYLDDTLIREKTASDTATSWEVVTELNATQMHLLTLEYAEVSQKAGVRLYWKTATTALEIVPASNAYPVAILDDFITSVTKFHRAAKFILGFELSETELDHLFTYPDDFSDDDPNPFDIKSITPGHWKRIYNYTTLRNAVPQAQALLTDVFALANRADPLPTVDELTEMLYLATAWDETSLAFLVHTHLALDVADFKNEIALIRLYEVTQIASKTGISAETIAEWGTTETDFDTLHSTAQLLKNTVKAKYEEEDWLNLAGNLNDIIRENQQQALVSYLLMQPSIQRAGVEDADGLFEYFLIDVQMCARMDTSRIVQANAAVQMFINRCLLNLESNISNGSEKGVSPGAIDKERWEWMENYRVWEANRKVFLFPENWLEPEWRNDRSEFFKELESYLVQNDITDRSVEQAFRNYLANLNEVANLDVCGMCREDDDYNNLEYLHVFARSHHAPYKFFYRRWNKHMKWSAWEKVQLDIRCVEDGDNSGVHLIPVVWKKRLFLFWPEFLEVQQERSSSTQSIKQLSEDSVSSLKSSSKWEIRLAWSEYVDGKWSPKQVSKEFIEVYIPLSESWFQFNTDIDSDNKLQISLYFPYDRYWYQLGAFILPDISSKIEIDETIVRHENEWTGYGFSFMKFSQTSQLQLLDNVYLGSQVDHRLLLPPKQENYRPTLADPFFFSDAYRTYFVRPVEIDTIIAIKFPGLYTPYLPVTDSNIGYAIPTVIPDIGLIDYLPLEGMIMPSVAGIGSGGANQPVGQAGTGPLYHMPVTRARARSGSTAALKASLKTSVSQNAKMYNSKVNEAFGLIIDEGAVETYDSEEKGLEFHTFYHPYSTEFVTNLNQGGLSRGNKSPEEYPRGLMESDTEIDPDDGSTFEDENTYNPNFTHGLVQQPSDFDTRTYYKENVCFDVYGANSLYNWELFFHAPLYIAIRLSKNGKYEEAMKWFHYIFDPTTDEAPEAGKETARYWKVLPFKTTSAETLEELFRELNSESDPSSPDYNPDSEYFNIISEWRDNPFDPHLVASHRPLAYMKHVVIKYVENLIAWGDSLFRQFTRESVYEALQIYVIANHILGPYPEFVPKRGEIAAESYSSLKDKWDLFSNALVELENIFPYSSDVSVSSTSTGTSLLSLGSALYFCIPTNDRLLEYWDTVADRLFKIRHCQDIDGVERELALFAPPISPEALIQAVSQGLSLGSILADLSSPPPIYRFAHLIQKANEFCADVKALGSALLSALEKKDAEELSRLRASHETNMLELITAIKERQVLDAKANKENLLKARETASFRLRHYLGLLRDLSKEPITVPAEPTVDAELTADSQLPVDTSITTVETDVDETLEDTDEAGIKLIPKEKEDLDKSHDSMISQQVATGMEGLAGILHLIPDLTAAAEPLGVGVGTRYGGGHLGSATSGLAKVPQIFAAVYSYQAAQAAKTAGFIRREQDWTLQANLAAKEIIQLDKQITSADIRIQVAEKELQNHQKQIENAEEVELFLKDKFTNQELYQWMKEQLFAVYKQSYNLAYDMAKKAEKAYKYELGTETASFIQYGYWDNSKQGLVSAEKLQLALRQLEKSYLEENRRELELSKSISLAQLNPLALIELKETGTCYVSLPEELFDFDYQGHYFRRLKSVSLSIPCIAGPYTTVNCSLRMLKNTTRINTTMSSGAGEYEHENDEGLWIDDDRFRTSNVPVTSIATSTGLNDTGMFEFSFRDERYLPFEGAGAISDWQIELSTVKELRQFDYSTISDVILHIKYTARENCGEFKDKAEDHIINFLTNEAGLSDQPFMRMFSMEREFPTEWHNFLNPTTEGAEQVLVFTMGKERFPFFTQERTVKVMKMDVFAKCTQDGDYHMILSYLNSAEESVTSSEITMPQYDDCDGLKKATINSNDAGLNLEEIDINKEMSLKLKHNTMSDYTDLVTDPDEVEDIYLVLHYKLGE